MAPRHVLVTGGRGFVGRALVRRLLAAGRRVTVLSSDPEAAPPPGADLVAADLTEPAAVAALRDLDVDGVCHLAARTRVRDSFADPAGVYATNVGGTAALLGVLRAAAQRRGRPVAVVLASTGAVYGPRDGRPLGEDLPPAPTNPYAASKAAAEQLLAFEAATGAVAAVTLRAFNVAGADGDAVDDDPTRLLPRALRVAAGSGAFPLNGDGSAVRELVHVADLADAYVLALDAARPGDHRVYNVGSGTGVSVAEMLAAVRRVTARPVPVERRPAADEPQALVADSRRIRAELGWTPRRSDLDTIVADAWAAAR